MLSLKTLLDETTASRWQSFKRRCRENKRAKKTRRLSHHIREGGGGEIWRREKSERQTPHSGEEMGLKEEGNN